MENALNERLNRRQLPSHGFKTLALPFPTNNNKIPVHTNGKSNSLDLFQRKHDKQAIQRLKRTRKDTKKLSSPFTAPGRRRHNGKPVFNLNHTCAAGNLHVRGLHTCFISLLMHSKGFRMVCKQKTQLRASIKFKTCRMGLSMLK